MGHGVDAAQTGRDGGGEVWSLRSIVRGSGEFERGCGLREVRKARAHVCFRGGPQRCTAGDAVDCGGCQAAHLSGENGVRKGKVTHAENCTGLSFSEVKNHAQTCTGRDAKLASVLDRIVGGGAARRFSKVPVLATLNPAISDAAHRLLSFMAVPGVGDGKSVMSAPDMGTALGWSERKVKYCVAELLQLRVIAVERKDGQANAYAIQSEVFAEIPRQTRTERLMKAKPALAPCRACLRLGVLKFGECLLCRKDKKLTDRVRRVVKEEMRKTG